MKRALLGVSGAVCLMIGMAEVHGASTPSAARTNPGVQAVKLVLHGATAQTGANKLRLLPDPQGLTDGDAYPLYQAAIKALPVNLNRLDQIPLDQFSVAEAKATIEELGPVLVELHKAARCRTCTWPEVKLGSMPVGLDQFRQLAYVLTSQAHYHLAKGEYTEAAKVISTGLAMARRLGQAHNLTQEFVGVAVGALICREVEQWIQCPNSPSLGEAIKDLPRPFIDPNEQIQREIRALRANPKYLLVRKTLETQAKPAHDRIRMLTKRLDRQIAALQAIEAIRLYAGKQGRLAKALGDVGTAIPNDPLTDKPFVYAAQTETSAVLEGPVPDGGTERDSLRYELTLVKDQ